MHPVRLILILLTCSLAGLTADAQNGSHQILGRSRASIPRPGVVKTEPTALAAGAERTVDLRTRPEAPEASAFGSQEMTFSSGHPRPGTSTLPTQTNLHTTRIQSTPVLAESSFPRLTSRLAVDEGPSAEGELETGVMTGPAVTVTSSLALVLGLFAGLVWLTRKFGTRSLSQGSIPTEVLQSLGSTSIDARTRITMLRCGNRILIVSQSPTGIQPIGEITDPEEVRELTATCLGESKQVFASTLASIEKEATADDFTGAQPKPTPRSHGRLFTTA